MALWFLVPAVAVDVLPAEPDPGGEGFAWAVVLGACCGTACTWIDFVRVRRYWLAVLLAWSVGFCVMVPLGLIAPGVAGLTWWWVVLSTPVALPLAAAGAVVETLTRRGRR